MFVVYIVDKALLEKASNRECNILDLALYEYLFYFACENYDSRKIDNVPRSWYIIAMDNLTCKIYIGDCYTLEWYFDENGISQAYNYFLEQSDIQKRKFLMLAKRMGDSGRIMDKTKFRNEGDGIYAFKPQPDRYLCFFCTGRKIIVTNAFTKKSQKLPEQEKNKCLKCRMDYEIRIRGGFND